MQIETAPATPDRWPDVVSIFEQAGQAGKCWCAYWTLPNRDFQAGWGPGNRPALEARVNSDRAPGVLAYADGVPAGWAGIAPRSDFDRLGRSKQLAPVDDLPVWSLNCFAVAKPFRRKGLMSHLIGAALDHAVANGATIVEAYPAADAGSKGSWDLYLGTEAAFAAAGFVEVARRSPRRPILRWTSPGA